MFRLLLAVFISFNLFTALDPDAVRIGLKKGSKKNELPAKFYRPQLYLSLPEYCNTPSGMTLDDENNILLSCPNFNNPSFPGLIMLITPQNKLKLFYALPVNPTTKQAGPMDLAFGPDRNLYVADNQYSYDKNYRSRLLRIRMQGGKPVGAEVVVEGFISANAITIRDNDVYVSDAFWDVPGMERSSGIFRFQLSEFEQGPVKLQPGRDPHLIAAFSTQINQGGHLDGVNGLVLDERGNLYAGIFGDGRIYKLSFDSAGNVASKEIFVDSDKLACIGGMFYDERRDIIYVTDSLNNAILSVSMGGQINMLWENADTDGSDGLLNQPRKAQIRNNRLFISNYDRPQTGLGGPSFNPPHTISVMILR